MTHVMLICIGMTWAMCHNIVRQEYPTMESCMADREYQRTHNKDVIWISCNEIKPKN